MEGIDLGTELKILERKINEEREKEFQKRLAEFQKVKLTCTCGAQMNISGDKDFIKEQRESFYSEHEACRGGLKDEDSVTQILEDKVKEECGEDSECRDMSKFWQTDGRDKCILGTNCIGFWGCDNTWKTCSNHENWTPELNYEWDTPKQVTDEYGNWFEIKFGKGSIKVNNEFAEMFGLTWKTPEKDQEKENE